MSQSSFLQQHGSSTQASTSAHPHQAISASYHPLPRPKPLPPLEPVDTQAVKQELHDALGENGLPYWKAMNGYLLGQVGKVELEGMVRRWLPKERLYLHNKLLFSILTNASASRQPPPSAAAALQKKRKRVAPDHPDYDTDDVTIEAKSRVAHWHTSLTVKDRNRLKRLMAGRVPGSASVQTGANAADGGKDKSPPGSARPGGAEAEGADWMAQLRQSSAFTPRTFFAPPATADRALPSSSQLADRIASIAPAYGLSVAPESASEIGEFLAVGMDAHLVDILHGVVSLTGADRPSGDGIHLVAGISDVQAGEEEDWRIVGRSDRKGSIANGHANVASHGAETGSGKQGANGAARSGMADGKRKWGEMNGDDLEGVEGRGAKTSMANSTTDANGDIDMNGTEPTDGPIKPLFKSPEALKANIAKWSSTHPRATASVEGPNSPGDRVKDLLAHFSLPASQATQEAVAEMSPPKKRKSATTSAPHAPPAKARVETAPALPRPTLDTLQHLFALSPDLHSQTSPALYKLAASQYQAESSGRRGLPSSTPSGSQANVEAGRVKGREGLRSGRRHSVINGAGGAEAGHAHPRDASGTAHTGQQVNGAHYFAGTGPSGRNGINGTADLAPSNGPAGPSNTRATDPPSIASVQRLTGPHRAEMISRIMLESGLLQPEKPQEEGKKRHSYHWKYEDPALMLRDVLG